MRALAQAKKLAKQSSSEYKAEENLAFEGDDTYSPDNLDVTQWDVPSFLRQLRRTLERRKSKSPVADVDSPNLNDAEWNWLTEKLSGKSVLQAFNLHDVIASALETCRRQMGNVSYADWPACDDALDQVDSAVNYLSEAQQSTQSQDISDLLAILQNPKFRGLLTAHDGVAAVWAEKAKAVPDLPATPSPTPEKQKPTTYASPVEGCYKILAVDDQGNVVPPMDGTILVNVVLQKDRDEYLGATVRAEGSAIVIGRIMSGGLIERSGLLNEGDELLSVNGIDLTGKDVDYVSDTLMGLSGRIVLLVAPALPITESVTYSHEPLANIRALFSYEPANDLYNPCPEAALEFDKGDILRVLTTRDPNWWQALRLDDEGAVGAVENLAGLIPSPFFQRQRSLLRLEKMGSGGGSDDLSEYESDASDYETECDSTDAMLNSPMSLRVSGTAGSLYASQLSCLHQSPDMNGSVSSLPAADPVWSPHGYGPKQIRRFERSRKLRMAKLKGMLSSKSRKTGAKSRREYYPSMSLAQIGQSDEDQLHWLEQEAIKSSVRRPSLLTYEPVELYYPQPQRRRPLIFVGPAHAGRQRLVEGLVDSDSKRFALPVIHTTNPDAKSTNHQTYECVTKEAFQQMQREHKLIEWGVFNQQYYGTTKASLEKLIRAGKTCVLSLRPDSIRSIRRTPFLPCVVFISPPERLEHLRQLTAAIFSPTMCSDDELAACIEQSKKIEMHYGHFFDFVVVPQDFQSALQELRKIALNLDRKPQWVPAHWIPLAIEVAAQAAEEAKRSSANSGP
ncbi:hypothetical protein AAHC03_013030 [Spirometra sp. Aus1]